MDVISYSLAAKANKKQDYYEVADGVELATLTPKEGDEALRRDTGSVYKYISDGTSSAWVDTSKTVLVDSSSLLSDSDIGVTLQPYGANTTIAGTTFNGNNELVQTTVDGKLPVLDGSNLTGILGAVTSLSINTDVLEYVDENGITTSIDLTPYLDSTVDSVAGKTGAVVLDKTDVGLTNVDNTSDTNKPISTATQTALDGKADDTDLTDGSIGAVFNSVISDGDISITDGNFLTTSATPKIRLTESGSTSSHKLQASGGQLALYCDIGATQDGSNIILAVDDTTIAKFETTLAQIKNADFSVNTNTFYVDAVNNKIGIGTTAPTSTLHNEGSIVQGSRVTTTENLLVGNTNHKVYVNGAGENLCTNGEFASDTTGWTPENASLAAVDGNLEVTLTAIPSRQTANYQVTLTANRLYKIKFDVKDGTSSNVNCIVNIGELGVADQDTGAFTTSSTWQTYEFLLTSGDSGNAFGLGNIEEDTPTAGTILFDNVSISEVQPSTNSKVYLPAASSCDGREYKIKKIDNKRNLDIIPESTKWAYSDVGDAYHGSYYNKFPLMNGLTDYIDVTGIIPNTDLVVRGGIVAFACWAKVDGSTTSQMLFSYRGGDTELLQVALREDLGQVVCQLRTSENVLQDLIYDFADTLNWHHYAVTFNFGASEIALWVDGVPVQTESISITGNLNSSTTLIGAFNNSGIGGFFTGQIHSVYIRQATTFGTADAVAMGNGTYTLTDEDAFYPMNEGYGTSINNEGVGVDGIYNVDTISSEGIDGHDAISITKQYTSLTFTAHDGTYYIN